jgi:hypothetical protein
MKTAVGIFTSRDAAEQAAEGLQALGITPEHLNLLTPGSTDAPTESMPTSDTERPGMGKAIGSVVGGAVGASSGLFGTAIASAVIPGIGPITAVGIAAAAILGAGGLAAGAAAGGALENSMAEGIPKDEVFVYEDALKQGKTVLVALTEDDIQYKGAHRVLEHAGAESLDAAREKWFVGLHAAEAEGDSTSTRQPSRQNSVYRRGFDTALQVGTFGKHYDEVKEHLRSQYGDTCEDEAFRQGYERGRKYSESFGKRWAQAELTRHDTGSR